jgi:uncharacterized protein (DUF58 family)
LYGTAAPCRIPTHENSARRSRAVRTAMSAAATRNWTFDGVVRMTRIGTSYLIFTLVIGFAALNTGNNALYIGLTFMLGCLLLSGVASKGGLKHLDVELRGLDEAWAGRSADAVLRITNRSRIWNVRDIVIASDELAQPVLVPIVERRSSVDVNAAFVFQRRGIASIQRIDLYTRYPFGFFLKKRRVRMSGEVVVFPRLLGDDVARDRFRPITGEALSANRPGQGTEVHSFREYVRGDSLRHIHWRKSASLGRWIMKQTDAESSRAVHVVVDSFKPRGMSDDAFEEMISAAATLVFHALQRGSNVILSMPRLTLSANESQSGSALFRALALIEAVHEPVAQTIDRDSIVFTLRRGDESATA